MNRDFLRNVVTATLAVREVLAALVFAIFLNGVLFSLVEGKDLGSSIYFAFITFVGFSPNEAVFAEC